MRPSLQTIALLLGIVVPALAAILTVTPATLFGNARQYVEHLQSNAGALFIILIALQAIVLAVVIRARKTRADQYENMKAAQTNSSPIGVPGDILIYNNRLTPAYKAVLQEALSTAVTIDAIGIANDQVTTALSVEQYKSMIIERGGKVRLLFLDPSSAEIKRRELAEGRDRGQLSYFVRHNIDDVKRFLSACVAVNPSVKDNIEVRLYSRYPHYNFLIINGDRAFIHHYGFSARGYDAPSLYVQSKTSSILQWYKAEWEAIWSTSKALSLKEKEADAKTTTRSA